MATDLDKGGVPTQWANVYLGPSLGWQRTQIFPQQSIVVAGTTALSGGAGIVLVNVAGLVTIQLPSCTTWMQEVASQPITAFDRSIWIKDYGGNAATYNITITPNGTDTIDGQASFAIITNYNIIRLYPLLSLTGWFVG